MSLLKLKEVWDGLMWFMLMVVYVNGVMLRNLGRMFSFGLLDFDSFGEILIIDKLKNLVLFKGVRIYFLILLVVEKVYLKCCNKKGII